MIYTLPPNAISLMLRGIILGVFAATIGDVFGQHDLSLLFTGAAIGSMVDAIFEARRAS